MNEFSRRADIKKDISGMKGVVGKDMGLLPAMRSKNRALEDVENFCMASSSISNSRLAAIERQRKNAEKLSMGLSVVHSKAAGDKENVKEPGKVLVRSSVLVSGKENSFRVPAKAEKQIAVRGLRKVPSVTSLQPYVSKPFGGLHKAKSVTSLEPIASESQQEKSKEEALTASVSSLIIADDKKYEKDLFLLGVYATDIYKYLKRLETQQAVRREYLTRHHQMNENMRAVLVDWMFEVQQSFQLLQDTAQMAVALLDRFMQDSPRVVREDLQLVGVTCIFIAAKYEEMYPPGVAELVEVSADTCSKQQILRMELRIFRQLDYSIGRPPPVQFLRRYCRVIQAKQIIYTLSRYYVDLALVQYRFCHLAPSLLAAVALYLALYVQLDSPLKDSAWTPTLQLLSGYSMEDFEPVVPDLARLILEAPKLKQKAVQQIYTNQKKYLGVSSSILSEKLLTLAARER